jgi:hypothetical protein
VASSDLNWSPVSWVLGVVLLCFSLCICFFIWLQLKKKYNFHLIVVMLIFYYRQVFSKCMFFIG